MADSKPTPKALKCFKCEGALGETITVVDDGVLACEPCYQKHGDGLFEAPPKRRSRSKSPARQSKTKSRSDSRSRSRYRSHALVRMLKEAREARKAEEAAAAAPVPMRQRRDVIWCGICKDPKCNGPLICGSKDDPECCAGARAAVYPEADLTPTPAARCTACKDPKCDGTQAHPPNDLFRCPAAREAEAKSPRTPRSRATLRPHVEDEDTETAPAAASGRSQLARYACRVVDGVCVSSICRRHYPLPPASASASASV